MLTPKLWADVGRHNGDKVGVVDFIYKGESGPRSGNLPESIFVQFCELDDDIEPLLAKITQTVVMAVVRN